MIACLDVDYQDRAASAAVVTFHDWPDVHPTGENVVHIGQVAPYEPGEFYRRELPCLLAVLETLPPIEVAVIDGYVWLDDAMKPGLGAHLYEALSRRTTVIGVAKSKFRGANHAQEVLRGTSARPLFVTSAGIPAELAADYVRSMHGAHRIPSLLARVDHLCRNAILAQP
jgi:deoxyribonuclease V